MGIFISVIVIVALIFYASKELLLEKDLPSLTNMALTALILFTVILSIYMILRKPHDAQPAKRTPAETMQSAPAQEQRPADPIDNMTDEDIMIAIAEEYLTAKDQYSGAYPQAKDADTVAANYIINKYEFTPQEWETFMRAAQTNNLFEKARQNIDKHGGTDYLVPAN